MEQISLFSLLKKPGKSSCKYPSIFIHKGLYILLKRKPYQRSMQLSIETEGKVQVHCAYRMPIKKICVFLDDHWPWIQSHLKEQKKTKKKYPLKKFYSGEKFLFQGKQLKLKYRKVFSRQQSVGNRISDFKVEDNNLIYSWSKWEDLSSDTLKIKLRNFYETKGRKLLSESVYTFSSRMRLFPQSIRIGSQKTLWGACSKEGNISLNWRLVAAPGDVLNYVVIHELSHLRYLNHSPAFWSLVSRFCPNYKEYEMWLKKNVYALDFLLFKVSKN